MRRVALAALIALFATPALAETLVVGLDQSIRLRVAGSARDVVVGNPKVADVHLIDSRNIVVLGKGYGATSILVVDQAGRTVLDQDVIVSAPAGGQASLYRGVDVETYACAARCEVSITSAARKSDTPALGMGAPGGGMAGMLGGGASPPAP